MPQVALEPGRKSGACEAGMKLNRPILLGAAALACVAAALLALGALTSRREPDPYWATQSGPMLVIDGELHPRFAEDGASRLMRNGVGARDGRTAYFVISGGFVSFGRFARFFRDELGCTDALFLDGSVSCLWAPSLGRNDQDHALGPMVVVLDRT